jgi:hypothetical protein
MDDQGPQTTARYTVWRDPAGSGARSVQSVLEVHFPKLLRVLKSIDRDCAVVLMNNDAARILRDARPDLHVERDTRHFPVTS